MTYRHNGLSQTSAGAEGAIAVVALTAWRCKNGAFHYIPDYRAQLPVLKKLLKRELAEV